MIKVKRLFFLLFIFDKTNKIIIMVTSQGTTPKLRYAIVSSTT